MRVFVVGTGRCGTCTFYQAAKHCDNYVVGHESFAGVAVVPTFPDHRLEVSSQLFPWIERLKDTYPDAKWVHLIRERESCVESLLRSTWESVSWWARIWFQTEHPYDIVRAGYLLYDYMNDHCKRLLLPGAFTLHLETAHDQWKDCWDYMQMTGGDFNASLTEWDHLYNHRDARGRDNYPK